MKKILLKILKFLLKTVVVILIIACIYLVVQAVGLKGSPSDGTWDPSIQYDPAESNTITKADGEDLTILLFSDIQVGASIFRDPKALKMMDELVAQVSPDFIMTTGDNSYAHFSGLFSRPVIKRLESYEIPWTVVLGNHDSEGIADRNWVGNRYVEADNSMFRMGPENIYGVGNHIINITDESGQLVYSLIMMDSNVTRRYDDGRDYDYIHPDQIEWYEWVVQGLGDVPSILTFHIPLPEFSDVKSLWEKDALDTATTFGENREKVYCPPVNTGMFDKVLELGNTTHIFVGHDHINCLSADYMGVRLTYGLKTGPACYADKDMQGATIITIKNGSNEVITEHYYIND